MAKDIGHSPVGASSRHRWANCPGSVNLCATVPPLPEGPYAAEGILAHKHAAYYLENHKWPKDCNDEMKENLQVYVDAVLEDRATLFSSENGNLFLIEHGFHLKMIHPKAFGTADCVIYDARKQILYVYDLKYGAGILVDVIDNEQLIYYAVGAFLSLDLPCADVVLKIAQPRCPHPDGLVREFRFDSLDLLTHASTIEAEIKATESPNAPLKAGDWCRFCAAAGVCPELSKKSLVVAQNIFAPNQSYDPQVLSDTLSKLPMVEAFIGQVREFAYAEAMKGRLPPHYKLVAKRATRKWKPDNKVGKFLSKVLNSKLISTCYTEPELKSPAQIEKIIPKASHEEMAEFVIAESTGYKLAHVSEKGEPILLDAKNLFEDETESLFL